MRKNVATAVQNFLKRRNRRWSQPRPLCCTKVHERPVTVNSMLSVGTGDALEALLQPSDVSKGDPDAATWTSVTIAFDQGDDGWSACQYVKHVVLIGDMNQRL